MMTQPLAVYRAVRTDDGQGGYTEGAPALLTTVWGTIKVYENETTIIIDSEEDVIVGDIIQVEEDV